MRFYPYPKIEDQLQHLGLSAQQHMLLQRANWVVTEKIHGANFCILLDGGGTAYAKRKALLEPGEDFFQYPRAVAAQQPQLQALYQLLASQHPGLRQVNVYGELFGGHYPHPDVAAVPGLQAIQTGVWYSPHIQFAAFDISIVVGDENNPIWLPNATWQAACATAGVPHAASLFVGKLNEAMAQSAIFATLWPARLGLPALPQNWAEGIVIKPDEPLLIPTDKGPVRPVLKIKHPKFAEAAEFHEAEKWNTQDLVRDEAALLAYLQAYAALLLTPQRLQAAISKIGQPSPEHPARMAQLIDEFVLDVLATLEQHQQPLLVYANGPAQEALQHSVTQAAVLWLAAQGYALS